MNSAKLLSNKNGSQYLIEALEAEQRMLSCQLDLSKRSITHDGVMGEINEQTFISFFAKYLPGRYNISSGIIIDSAGKTSDQIDVVIYDRQYTPTLLDQHDHRFIPAEAVYCILEAKPKIDRSYLEYASKKAQSVRKLIRTTIPIPHAGGTYQPKKLFQIIAGIIAIDSGWTNGIECSYLEETIKSFAGSDETSLQCGVALNDKAFFAVDGNFTYSSSKCSLAFFLFRLLNNLQSLGTVPAIDWNQYSTIFCNGNI